MFLLIISPVRSFLERPSQKALFSGRVSREELKRDTADKSAFFARFSLAAVESVKSA